MKQSNLFDNWNFSLSSFRLHSGPRVNSDSNRNEYRKYFLGGKVGRSVGLTILPPSCADYLENREPQPSANLRVCPDLCRDCFTFTYLIYIDIYQTKYNNMYYMFVVSKLCT